MRIAYLDCFSGISGDMFLGALVDAGVSPRLLEETVAALDLDARLEIGRVRRAGISATKVDVVVHGRKDLPIDETLAGHSSEKRTHPSLRERVGHPRDESHICENRADVVHPHDRAHGYHPHRGLGEIRAIIDRAPISNTARERALAMFEALGRAEAKIHETELDQVRFHEVGGEDAIVDIVCAAVGSEALGIDEWICSPLNVGSGSVRCAHGTLPVPAPATLEILKECGAPIYSGEVRKELVTPTGAAIVSVLAKRFESMPKLKLDRIGYGAGFRDFEEQPNVLRLLTGEAAIPAVNAETESITILETNIDDLNPQVFGYVIERALAIGALDVFGLPVQMKKDRPGTLLTVLCKPEQAPELTRLLFAETSTLGVRTRTEQRYVLERRHVSVQTHWGEVGIKLGSLNGTITNYAPEYEDCRRLASEHGVPLKSVMQEAIRLYLERKHD